MHFSIVDKASLRTEYLNKRKSLSRSQYWILSDQILDQVKTIDWNQFKTVHIFLPISKYNEIDTFSVMNYFTDQHPKLQVILPRTNFKTLEMEHVLFDPLLTILGRNKFDIPEPIYGRLITADKIDAVITPLLAFDKKGSRVGYGKGFYDRFLSNCRADVQKIGLSFFDPVEEVSDVNELDIALNQCISPGKVWKF
ncbi:MAG: 5-formyltetrahydrofolate cyclo-ligase [Sphingobacteriales bacterium]|nr:5-formyltetrahydrofolate cyclo-ligase [Sphingobacteriales bacterium]